MAVATPVRNQQQPRIPFRKGTRQHWDSIGVATPTFAALGQSRLTLPQVGLLAGVLVHADLVANFSMAGGALTADGPWAIIRRLRLALNTGVNIFSATGFGTFILSHFHKENFDGAASGETDVFSAGVAMGNNTWNLFYWIPVAANDGLNFEVGLINLQTEELRATVEIDWGAVADAGSGGGTLTVTGDARIHALFYEIPDPRAVDFPPLNVVHRVEEERTVISGTGDVRYPVLRQGSVMQLIHIVRLNGARNNADVDAMRLELNRSDRVYRYLRRPRKWQQRMQYGQDLPAGVFSWDFWQSQLQVSQGDGRDFVDTEAVAQVDSVMEIASGAVLGANNNFLDTLRRITQTLAA